MGLVKRAANIAEAIALASEFREQGCDLFRGQSRDWPVRSSLNRLSANDREIQVKRLAHFVDWMKETPGLEQLAADIDSTLIVAQHYGLPTNYLDFTSDPSVAAFFSCQPCDEEEGDACIICLNSGEFESIWQMVAELPSFQNNPVPLLHRAIIPDLWRLEAQRGVAMFMPYTGIEGIFDFDRILFPAPPTTNALFDRSRYYPTEKSQLEGLLDQFFQIDRARQNQFRPEEFGPGVKTVVMKPMEQVEPGVACDPFPDHPSWHQADEMLWLEGKLPAELYNDGSSVFEIDLHFSQCDKLKVDTLFEALLDALHTGRLKRNQQNRMQLNVSQQPELETSIQRLWDGMRRLPFKDHVVASALSTLAKLCLGPDPDAWQKANRAGNVMIGVEFDVPDGSYSRSFGSRETFSKITRSDLGTYLTDTYRDRILNDPKLMIQLIRSPRKLFPFQEFVEVFGTELLPIQEFIRPAYMTRVYSPLRIRHLGLP